MRSFTAVFAPLFALALAASFDTAAQAGLTPQEQRWVEGTWPVVVQARQQGLPVDIVVQPQAMPHAAPVALAYLGGRCKLVFSLRGNPAVPEQEERIAQHLGPGAAGLGTALELMAAHELFGHCARHVAGLWLSMPDGYAETVPERLDRALHGDFTRMRALRREEGYADLAALAWARVHRQALFPRLHAWLLAERRHDLVAGSAHDTLAWLHQAGSAAMATVEVWRHVLLDEAAADAADARRSTTTAQSGGH